MSKTSFLIGQSRDIFFFFSSSLFLSSFFFFTLSSFSFFHAALLRHSAAFSLRVYNRGKLAYCSGKPRMKSPVLSFGILLICLLKLIMWTKLYAFRLPIWPTRSVKSSRSARCLTIARRLWCRMRGFRSSQASEEELYSVDKFPDPRPWISNCLWTMACASVPVVRLKLP